MRWGSNPPRTVLQTAAVTSIATQPLVPPIGIEPIWIQLTFRPLRRRRVYGGLFNYLLNKFLIEQIINTNNINGHEKDINSENFKSPIVWDLKNNPAPIIRLINK